jgi:hypothetical protein
MKFHEYQSIESPAIACGRTNRRYKVTAAFSNCSVKAPKHLGNGARGSDKTVLEMRCELFLKCCVNSCLKLITF